MPMVSLEAFLFVLFVSFVDDAFLSCVCVTSVNNKAGIIAGKAGALGDSGEGRDCPERFDGRIV